MGASCEILKGVESLDSLPLREDPDEELGPAGEKVTAGGRRLSVKAGAGDAFRSCCISATRCGKSRKK